MKTINPEITSVSQKKNWKEKIPSTFSSLSGGLSFLGGWQVCHNLCLGIIALLSLIGISVAGMPLFFLTKYSIYFWSAAVTLLIPTGIIYWKNRAGMSNRLILFNLGIIIAAFPLVSVKSIQILLWMGGGGLILTSIFLYVKAKWLKPRISTQNP